MTRFTTNLLESVGRTYRDGTDSITGKSMVISFFYAEYL